MFRRTAVALTATVWLVGCNSGNSPTPAPPGPGGGETITGRERIGWDQAAGSAAELPSLRFAIYVDGARSEVTDVSCATTAGAAGFACSGRLPAMSPGSHVLEIASYVDAGGIIESARSAPLRVTVAGSTVDAETQPLATGETIYTSDGIPLMAARVLDGLDEPTDIATAPDGRIFITDARGRLTAIDDGRRRELLRLAESEGAGGLLGVALAPDFATSGHVFVVAGEPADGSHVFRIYRYRVADSAAIERMVLLPDVPASSRPAAAIRFGPDGKLYVALDAADDDERAARPSEWSGKILRLEPDGRTPRDQPAASPVLQSGIRVPRGLTWTSDGTLWEAEEGIDGVERLRASVRGDGPEGRAIGHVSYALPQPFGARSLAAYDRNAVPAFSQDLFLAGGQADYLLRISLDEKSLRAVRSERLLEGRIETVRAVAVSHDGSILFCTADELWQLTASSAPPQGRGPR